MAASIRAVIALPVLFLLTTVKLAIQVAGKHMTHLARLGLCTDVRLYRPGITAIKLNLLKSNFYRDGTVAIERYFIVSVNP